MDFAEGRIGRVFAVRVDHGEDLLSVLNSFVRKKGIQCAMAQFLGALSEGKVVTGPERALLPPSPNFEGFSGGWEIFGMASIYPGDDGPMIHLHISAGRGRDSLTGCLREVAKTYIVVEVFIIEFVGFHALKILETKTGLKLPSFQRERSNR
jgi:predicted DNA-binding protein with PD1-like motif